MHLIKQMYRRATTRSKDAGASLVEYALLVALISVVCMASLVFFQNQTQQSYSNTASRIGHAGD